MARIRTIKPQFFMDEDIAEIPFVDRLIFIGLWCLADCEGRLKDSPKRIKAEILPYDDHDVDASLQNLHNSGFIIRYQSESGTFIQIINFLKHQRITGKEAEQESDIEPPENTGETTEEQQGNTGETTETTGREGKGKERKGKERGRENSAFVLPAEIDPSAWTGFEEMRKKIRKPMTDRARRNIVTKLLSFKAKGHDPTKILDESITKSWQDVYEPKQEVKHAGPQNGSSGGQRESWTERVSRESRESDAKVRAKLGIGSGRNNPPGKKITDITPRGPADTVDSGVVACLTEETHDSGE